LQEIRAAVRENQLGNPNAVTLEHYWWFIDYPGIWVWEEDSCILGLSAADPRDGTIWALFVDPAHERKGIGRALFQAACDTLRESGHRVATLSTGPGTRAERFYLAAGWSDAGRNAKGEIIFRSPPLG